MPTHAASYARVVLAALALGAGSAGAQATPNTLTAAERAAGWRLLFDGRTFAGWRELGGTGIPAEHWKIVDGAIEKVATRNVAKQANGRPAPGGDLLTEETFGDFELAWEWKVTPGANSGLKYNVSEELSAGTPPTSHAAVGFEYQMIDDEHHPDGKLVKHKTGDLYDLISSNDRKRVKPIGEWNESRVVFRGTHGEHWLNGAKVVEYELGTPAMAAAVAASKFKMPWFAERRRGHIVLQDHGDEVYFRSIRLRPLDASARGGGG